MRQMRIGRPPNKSNDWKMGNAASRGINISKESNILNVKWFSYTKEEVEFVRNNYLKYTDIQLSEILNRTTAAISCLRSRHGLNRERRTPFKCLLKLAIREAQMMRELWCITQDMKALILICQLDISQYKKERYKKELLRLSNLNLKKIKPLK